MAKRKKWGCLVGTGVFVALLGLGLTKVGYFSAIGAANQYDEEFAAAQKEGAIITPNDLRKRYGSEDPRNVAPLIRSLPENSEFSKQLGKMNKKVRQEYPPALVDLARQHVAPWGNLDDYLATPVCDFKYRWELGAMVLFPEFAKSKMTCKALMVLARDAAHSGKTDEAIKYLRVGRKMATDIAQTPCLIAMLVEVADYAIVHHTVIELAHDFRSNQALAARLREFLKDPIKVDIRRAMEGEMMFHWHAVNNLGATTQAFPSEDGGRVFERMTMVPGLKSAWKTRALQWMRETKRFLDRDAEDWNALMTDMEGQGKALDTASRGREGLSYVMETILQPVFTQAIYATIKPETQRRMCLAWMDTLGQTTEDLPTKILSSQKDPFTGASFSIRTSKYGTYYVASPGRNGKDDTVEGGDAPGVDDVFIPFKPLSK